MTRTLILILLTLIALIVLAAALNAPRVAEAQAHHAAATAMHAQATVTGLAVIGMTCLAAVLGLVVAGLGVVGWLMVHGYLPNRDRIQPVLPGRPHLPNRRLRLPTTTLSRRHPRTPLTPDPPVTVYAYPDEIETIPFTLPPGWETGDWPDQF